MYQKDSIVTCIKSVGLCECGHNYVVQDINDNFYTLKSISTNSHLQYYVDAKVFEHHFKQFEPPTEGVTLSQYDNATIVSVNLKDKQGSITIVDNKNFNDVVVSIDCPNFIVNNNKLRNHYLRDYTLTDEEVREIRENEEENAFVPFDDFFNGVIASMYDDNYDD